MSTSYDQLEPAELVRLARARDQAAWNEIVRRYGPMVWRMARSYRLDSADAKDACQNTWFLLAEHLSGLREPDKLARWLAVTARRESLRVLRFRQRERLGEWWPERVVDPVPDRWPEPRVLRTVRDRLLWQAFSGLSERCQRLLGLLAHAPDLNYDQLGQALGIKTGSVGSSRGRCLLELRRRLAVLGIWEGAAG